MHDRLEELGWQVEIADAQNVKGACAAGGSDVLAAVALLDDFDRETTEVERGHRRLGAAHP